MTDRTGTRAFTGAAVPLAVLLITTSAVVISSRGLHNAVSTGARSKLPVPGQAAASPHDPAVPEPAATAEPLTLIKSVVGRSVEGRPIEHWQIGDGEYHILLLASIHGNENRGTSLLHRLSEHLELSQRELLEDCSVVLLPTVNPDGVEANSRFNSQGVDLNRNFPAGNRENSKRYGMQALSEPEAVAIHRVILDFQPDHIVTLHEPLNCVDYDGPAGKLAEAMAESCPLPVKKLGSRPGSLGSFAGVTLQIPTITYELPRDAKNTPDQQLWKSYGESLIEAIRYRHVTSTASSAHNAPR